MTIKAEQCISLKSGFIRQGGGADQSCVISADILNYTSLTHSPLILVSHEPISLKPKPFQRGFCPPGLLSYSNSAGGFVRGCFVLGGFVRRGLCPTIENYTVYTKKQEAYLCYDYVCNLLMKISER